MGRPRLWSASVCQLTRHSERYVISKIPQRAQDNELICRGEAEVFARTVGSVNTLDLLFRTESRLESAKPGKDKLKLITSSVGTSRKGLTHTHRGEV